VAVLKEKTMKTSFRTMPFIAIILSVMCFAGSSASAQDATPSDFDVELQALEATTPIPASQLPESGTFWSAQHATDWPPLPSGFLNVPAWPLGDDVFVLDDLNINYSELAQAAQSKIASSGQLKSKNNFSPDFLITPANIGFSISQQATNIVLKWQSTSNRIYMVEQRPTLTSSSYWTELTNYVLSASTTNITSLVLTNLIRQQPIDFFRLFDVTPIASNDFFSVDQDSSANQLNIFQNDVDPNGDPIFISNIVPASHGGISYSSDATTFQYTPTAGFYGIDTFQYSITSGYGDVSSNATVKVFVNKTGNSPPVAPEIDIVLPTNTYTATFNALTNATDPDGDTISLYAVTSPSLGTVSNDTSGNIYYSRNPNKFGSDSFMYIVTDGNGGYGECFVKISQVDSDGDGMPDQWELKYGLNPASDDSMADPDGDGLPNLAEYVLGTNPKVSDNPLNLSAVTTGMQLSGYVQIPILGLSPSLAQTPPITFYVNGEPAENSFVSQGADGGWLINWDTTYLTNGSYQIQASVQFNPLADITIGQSNEVFGATKTVEVDNPITFNKLTTTFGSDLYITGTLADTNDTYDVYLYDPMGDLLVYATNVFAPNGQIGLSWDLTDGNGHQISFGNIQAVFYLHSQSNPDEIQPLDQYSGSPAVHHWYLTDTASVDVNVFAVAWGFDDYNFAFDSYRTELMEDGVIEILDNPSDFSSYTLLPANNVPYADSTFRYDDDIDKSILVNPTHPGKGDLSLSGNFFWFGHGAANVIAGNPNHSIITPLDVVHTLNNNAYTSTDKTPENNNHPYKLVILNGCQTYSFMWASAFGIDYSAGGSSDLVSDYDAAGRQPRAFVGWTKLIGVPGNNDLAYEGILDADYGDALGVMCGEWMEGYPIYQCVGDYSTQALYLVPLQYLFQNVDSWQISGCYDLQRGD
jgi:hypothetical protein